MTRAPSSPSKPRVGITIGDTAGIGPEITLRAVAESDVLDVCVPVIIGDAREIKRQAVELGLNADFVTVDTAGLGAEVTDAVMVDTNTLDEPVPWGSLSAATGRAAIHR